MKRYSFLMICLFSVLGLFGQIHKVDMFCELSNGYNSYVHPELFPDSVTSVTAIHYRKLYTVKSNDDLLLLMKLDGWKLVNAFWNVQMLCIDYFMTKEIYLDDTAYKLYVEKLKRPLPPGKRGDKS